MATLPKISIVKEKFWLFADYSMDNRVSPGHSNVYA